MQRLTVKADEEGKKIDKFLRQYIKELSFAAICQMLRKGQIKINGKRKTNSYELQVDDVVEIHGCNPLLKAQVNTMNIHRDAAQKLISQIVYKDENIIAINKPAGLAVQGGTNVPVSVDVLCEYLKFDLPKKPKLVHRIDKDTSGLLILARHDKSARELALMFQKSGTIKKTYVAICNNFPIVKKGIIDMPLGKARLGGFKEMMSYSDLGDDAVTHYNVIKHNERFSLINFQIITGRTHQVRAHACISGMPIVGDRKYNYEFHNAVRVTMNEDEKDVFILTSKLPVKHYEKKLCLHSQSAEFELFGEKISINAPIPDYFETILSKVGL